MNSITPTLTLISSNSVSSQFNDFVCVKIPSLKNQPDETSELIYIKTSQVTLPIRGRFKICGHIRCLLRCMYKFTCHAPGAHDKVQRFNQLHPSLEFVIHNLIIHMLKLEQGFFLSYNSLVRSIRLQIWQFL